MKQFSDRKLLLGAAFPEDWHVEAIRERLPLTSKEGSLSHGQHAARRSEQFEVMRVMSAGF